MGATIAGCGSPGGRGSGGGGSGGNGPGSPPPLSANSVTSRLSGGQPPPVGAPYPRDVPTTATLLATGQPRHYGSPARSRRWRCSSRPSGRTVDRPAAATPVAL